MPETIREIIKDILDEGKIHEIDENYQTYKGLPLSDIGIDSLYVMGIILKIGSVTKKQIDFENFSFEDINTLNKMYSFIERQM